MQSLVSPDASNAEALVALEDGKKEYGSPKIELEHNQRFASDVRKKNKFVHFAIDLYVITQIHGSEIQMQMM